MAALFNNQPPVRPNQSIQEIELDVLRELRAFLRQFELELHEEGVILRGKAYSFYGKQLALHAVRARSPWPVIANRLEVVK